MRRPRPSLLAAVCGAALALAAGAAVARASFSSSQSAGPMSVTAAALAAPSGLAVSVASCTPKTSYTLSFAWTASSPTTYVAGYTVLSSTTSGGPYTTTETTVSGATTTSATVTYTTNWQTPMYYVVEATGGGWTSATSAEATITTPKFANCR